MAVLVVWSHSFALYRGSEATEPLSVIMQGTVNSGKVAVYIFFMVSGYLITQSFDRSRNAWSYLRKRVARIYPGFMVATSFCAFFIVPLYSTKVRYTAALVVKTIAMNVLLRGYFADDQPFTGNPNPALNGSLWSIPYEFWCYLGVLALGLVGPLRVQRRRILLGVFIAASATGAWLEVTGKRPGGGLLGAIIGSPYGWFKVLPCFLVGMLVYCFRDVLPRRLSLVVLLPAMVVFVANLPILANWKSALVGVLFPPCVAYTVFFFAFQKRWVDVARYGDISYGTYLYAFPVQQVLISALGTSMPFWLFIPVAIVLSLAAGAISWITIERWFNISGRHKSPSATEVSFGGAQPMASGASLDS